MNSMWTVTAFTIRNKLRTKSFIITTLILAILLVVVGNLPYLLNKLGAGDEKATTVGYIAGEQADVITGLQQFFQLQGEQATIVFEQASSEQAAKELLESGDISGFITFKDNAAAGFPDAVYHSDNAFGSSTSSSLKAALQMVKNELVLRDFGLTDQQKIILQTPVQLSSEKVSFTNEEGKTAEEQGIAMGLVYVLIILLFMTVMISGQLIATEITAEKSSRVMEIIVTSVAPLKQMFGKIIGTFIVSIVQLIVLIGALVANLMLPHNVDAIKGFGIDLSKIDSSLLVYAVFFYLIGFFLYATLFAAIGSIVSRTEDLGQAVMPVTMLTLAGFYIAIFGMNSPESTLVVVSSYFPFFTPFLMFMRIGLTEPALWEIALSIGILIVTTLFIGWLSAKIYRTGVLMYGKRPSMKELFKAMKAYKV